MLSTDTSILEIGSESYVRMREYAELVDELHIVILCAKKSGVEIHDDHIHLYPTNSENKLQRLIEGYKTAVRIIAERAMTGVDSLITCQDPFELGLIGVRLKKRFGLKLQLQVHTDFANSFFIRESIKNKLRFVIAWQTLSRADGIRVVSERIKQSLVANARGRFNVDKILVLPIFVETDAIAKVEPLDLSKKYPGFEFYIVMVSRLTNEKQVVWAAQVVRRVRELHPEVCLVIVGDGPVRAQLEQFDFVRVAGWVKNPIDHMKGANLFLNTSLYEGYGRTLVEAAASGVPVVTTDVGVARKVVRGNGLIVPPQDAEALYQALLNVIEERATFTHDDNSAESISKTIYLQEYLQTWTKCF